MENEIFETIEQQAATLAHEIKNPLATIRLNVQCLELEDSISTHKKYYDAIYRQINKVTDMAIDLIKLSNVPEYYFEQINPNVLIADALSEFEPLLTQNDTSVTLNLAKNIILNGDYKKLLQVFINIIKNAIEATVCDKPEIHINMEEFEGNCAIKFSDNGSGINEGDIGKVCDMFYTTKENGSGIGLSMCKKIIAAHNGSLDIFSVSGKGCTVTVTLPISK